MLWQCSYVSVIISLYSSIVAVVKAAVRIGDPLCRTETIPGLRGLQSKDTNGQRAGAN